MIGIALLTFFPAHTISLRPSTSTSASQSPEQQENLKPRRRNSLFGQMVGNYQQDNLIFEKYQRAKQKIQFPLTTK